MQLIDLYSLTFLFSTLLYVVCGGTMQPDGFCACLHSSAVEYSGLEPWSGTLCCVLEQDILLSQHLPPPRCIIGYRQI